MDESIACFLILTPMFMMVLYQGMLKNYLFVHKMSGQVIQCHWFHW